MKTLVYVSAAASALMLTACQNASPAQRNAAIGTAVGAAAGAAVAGDETTGALVGGALGAGVGYYTGCRQQGGCFVGGEEVNANRQYDARADRYFFVDPQTGDTYWANGDIRTR